MQAPLRVCVGGGGTSFCLSRLLTTFAVFIRTQMNWDSHAWLLYVGLGHKQEKHVTLGMQRNITADARCSYVCMWC